MFAPDYFEAVLITKLKKVSDDGQEWLEPVLPTTSYMTNVFVNGVNFRSDQITDMSLNNIECITHCVFSINDLGIIKGFPGYLGKGFFVTGLEEYKRIVGSSKPLWKFLQEDYKDE